MGNRKDVCRILVKFDGHYTPECVGDHGQRLNGSSKAYRFKFCPFCGKEAFVPQVFENGNYRKFKKPKVD